MGLQAPPLLPAPMRPRVPTFLVSRALRAFSTGAKECKVAASATDAKNAEVACVAEDSDDLSRTDAGARGDDAGAVADDLSRTDVVTVEHDADARGDVGAVASDLSRTDAVAAEQDAGDDGRVVAAEQDAGDDAGGIAAEQDAGAVGDEKDLYAAAGGDAKHSADQDRLLKSLEETLEKHGYGANGLGCLWFGFYVGLL